MGHINGALWNSIDGYAATPGTRQIPITLNQPGPHELEIRNRSRHSLLARQGAGYDPAVYTLRFEQLDQEGEYDVNDIQYVYDALSRLQTANYNAGETVYSYGFDVAGNLTNMNGVGRTYNAVNQLIDDGTNTLDYDRNGNMIGHGVNVYGYDRANRMTFHSWGITHLWRTFSYDGLGNRFQQAQIFAPPPPDPTQVTATDYILDLQPGLTQVIAATTGANTERYIHSPRGIHVQQTPTGAWQHPLTDGLHSVRSVMDNALSILESTGYAPFGVPDTPLTVTDFAFTGEMRDGSELQYHRARYYAPGLGVWTALDPLETRNRYAYVNGNPVNFADPLGLQLQAQGVVGLCVAQPELCAVGVIAVVGAVGALYVASQAGVDIDLPDISLPSISAPDLSVLLRALFSSPEMDPVLQAQLENALCSHTAPGMPGSCNPTAPAIPTATPGPGDWTDAERQALADACNGSLCGGDIGVVTEVVVPTITWIPTRTQQPWQDHRNFQPDGSSDPDPAPIQDPAPAPMPELTQTPTPTPDAPKHITLGFENTRGRTTLSNFTRILRRRLGTSHVYWFEQWQDAGLSSVNARNLEMLEIAFAEATTNAEQIHFNLDGFPRSVDESDADAIAFVRQYGNGGGFPSTQTPGIFVSAVELFRVVSDGKCYKTKFYRNAYTDIPDNLREVPIEGNAICNAGFSR